jgi:uncharacterized protein YeaO (DUF488 family)
MGVITLARVYDDEGVASGPRFLVERLWPRGVRRADLRLSDWLPDVGPSTELRRWFGHEPLKWEDFRRRYFDELERHPEAWRPLRDAAAVGDITLLYSSRDVEHNNAVALREYLMARLESTSSDDLARAATAEGTSLSQRHDRGPANKPRERKDERGTSP